MFIQAKTHPFHIVFDKIYIMSLSLIHRLSFFLLLSSLASSTDGVVGVRRTAGSRKLAGESPFTAKASFIRYWKKQVSGDLPEPWFLNKASPLDGVQLAMFSKLADQNMLSTQIDAFCSEANLLCYHEVAPSLSKNDKNVDFTTYDYDTQNFTNYGTKKVEGFDSFKNYSAGENIPFNSFKRYSRDSVHHNDKFSTYAGPDTNVDDQEFKSYGTSATAGSGDFSTYGEGTNIPDLKFTHYSEDANGRKQQFTSYSDNANGANNTFTSYGSKANEAVNEFTSYANSTNVVTPDFSSYGEYGKKANDTFTSYGSFGNVPENFFTNYEAGGSDADAKFANYRDESNVGDDVFKNYGKGSTAPNVTFKNYGENTNPGSSRFTSYGKGAQNQAFDFTTYVVKTTTFKQYAKTGVTFSDYRNGSIIEGIATKVSVAASAEKNNGMHGTNRWVAGKFFREEMLKTGKLMPMPDIRDRMPKRSFLPKLISSKLPFSSGKIEELLKIFRVRDDSTMSRMIKDALNECERAPSLGETKRCTGSAEDMVDFATSILGRNVAVRSTENTHGSKGDILIGSVKAINGGKVTKSVSCHQSLFPYLLYYCHSVPKVRVYEADILDITSKAKINRGVAICHIDTSSWSPTHGAFIALGPGPGKIEVCHWIFENDMTWTSAD